MSAMPSVSRSVYLVQHTGERSIVPPRGSDEGDPSAADPNTNTTSLIPPHWYSYFAEQMYLIGVLSTIPIMTPPSWSPFALNSTEILLWNPCLQIFSICCGCMSVATCYRAHRIRQKEQYLWRREIEAEIDREKEKEEEENHANNANNANNANGTKEGRKKNRVSKVVLVGDVGRTESSSNSSKSSNSNNSRRKIKPSGTGWKHQQSQQSQHSKDRRAHASPPGLPTAYTRHPVGSTADVRWAKSGTYLVYALLGIGFMTAFAIRLTLNLRERVDISIPSSSSSSSMITKTAGGGAPAAPAAPAAGESEQSPSFSAIVEDDQMDDIIDGGDGHSNSNSNSNPTAGLAAALLGTSSSSSSSFSEYGRSLFQPRPFRFSEEEEEEEQHWEDLRTDVLTSIPMLYTYIMWIGGMFLIITIIADGRFDDGVLPQLLTLRRGELPNFPPLDDLPIEPPIHTLPKREQRIAITINNRFEKRAAHRMNYMYLRLIPAYFIAASIALQDPILAVLGLVLTISTYITKPSYEFWGLVAWFTLLVPFTVCRVFAACHNELSRVYLDPTNVVMSVVFSTSIRCYIGCVHTKSFTHHMSQQVFITCVQLVTFYPDRRSLAGRGLQAVSGRDV